MITRPLGECLNIQYLSTLHLSPLIEKIFAISDLHIGNYHNPYAVEAFVDLAIRTPNCIVVAVGDIFELINSSMMLILSSPLHRRSLNNLRRLAQNKDLYIVKGNHDIDLEIYAPILDPIRILLDDELNFITEEGIITFLHGHQDRFDKTTKFFEPLIRIFRRWIPDLYKRFYGTPSELKERNRMRWELHSGGVASLIFSEAIEKKKQIIYGHLHRCHVNKEPTNYKAGCCGDMVSELSYIEIDLTTSPISIEPKWINCV